MPGAIQAIFIASLAFALLSDHPRQAVYAKDSAKEDERSASAVHTWQKRVEVPQDVLLNTLYYLVGDVEYIPQSQGIPVYHISNLEEPKYIEIKLKPHGYLLASLTKEDVPVVRFNGEPNAKPATEVLGEVHKYVIYDESFDVTGIELNGMATKSLSNWILGWNISDYRMPTEQSYSIKTELLDEAEQKWSHDYVMECDRHHTIAICSEKFGNGVTQLRFPDDFQVKKPLEANGAVWDDVQGKFVELEKQGDNWVKGSSESPWRRDHISVVIEKRVGKCGYAKLNIPCNNRIYDKPLWIGDTRITIVKEELDYAYEDTKMNQQLPENQEMRKWSSWSSWSTYKANDYQKVPNYSQHKCCGCLSGCGPLAWAMLFAWADQRSDFSNTIYGTAAESPPSFMTPDVEKYVEEIRSRVGTFCVPIFKGAATYPWKMKNIRDWFRARGGGDLKTKYNILGIRTSRLRDCARRAITDTKRPVVIGTGWLKHYPVATQYRVRSRTRKILFIKQRQYDREAYLNQGWGGNGNGWQNLRTWFCGTISP